MKLRPFLIFTFSACVSLAAHGQQRPRITGISHMCVYSTDPAATEHFYTGILKAQKRADPEDPAGARYYFSPAQFVEVLPLPAEHTISRMAHIGYTVTDASGLRQYLSVHGIAALSPIHKDPDDSLWFETKDPEGNLVQFVQGAGAQADNDPLSSRMIHVGFEVHNKPSEDRFYRELLGFRPYWYGAMKPEKVDWVSQQVPEGHDWLEYMLVGDGSTTPLDRVDAGELGVLNHFSLGVPNMEQAVTTLIRQNPKSPVHDGPQMGRDGKWQANLYDPDGTRVELMEFQPVTKPCCSEFTAASPQN